MPNAVRWMVGILEGRTIAGVERLAGGGAKKKREQIEKRANRFNHRIRQLSFMNNENGCTIVATSGNRIRKTQLLRRFSEGDSYSHSLLPNVF